MKTKWSFLMIIALLAVLAGAGATPAQALGEPVPPKLDVPYSEAQAGSQAILLATVYPLQNWYVVPYGTMSFYIDGASSPTCTQTLYTVPGIGGSAGCNGPSDLSVGEHTFQAVYTPASDVAAIYATASGTGKLIVNPVNTLRLDNEELQGAGIHGDAFDIQFLPNGGTAPYVFSSTDVPPGLTLESSGRLHGTLSQAGRFHYIITLTDSLSVTGSFVFSLFVDPGIYTLTSSANPSGSGDVVTFTLSASSLSGTQPDRPFGTVTFYDGSSLLCQGVPLNTQNSTIVDLPASCEASSLAAGTHNIVAIFFGEDKTGTYLSQPYFRLTQEVQAGEPTYSISGIVFNDLDGDGAWDTGENGLYGAYVSIDRVCDGTADGQVPVSGDGSYSHGGLPGGVCFALGGWHPANAYDHNGWKQTTPAVQFDLLSADQTGVNIGLQEYSLDYTPRGGPGSTGLLDGQLNQPYSQTITVLGGFAPYTYEMGYEGNLPVNGLGVSLDGATGIITISGTPTAAGAYFLDMYVTDANGAEIEAQGSFFIKTDASFNLISSANPARVGDPVTFSLSATGTVVNYLPQAPVTFKADGVVIAGCDGLFLGYNETDDYINPVQCTTSALAVGSHVITADFAPGGGPYNSATITLSGGQVVEAAPPVTYSISGQLFYDSNWNGILDGTESPTYAGQIIQLDQGCDGTADASFTLAYEAQTYTFAGLPAGMKYCVSYHAPNLRQTTPTLVTDSLSQDWTGVNIGFYNYYLGLEQSVFLDGPVNEVYQRTIRLISGFEPYTFFQTDQALPAGLTAQYNSNGTIVISGTPTQPGEYSFNVEVADSYGTRLLRTLTFWIQAVPHFTFTSTLDPWVLGQDVTFSLGIDDPDHLPFFGYVTFYASGAAIQNCSDLRLWDMTLVEWWPEARVYNPVTCTTPLPVRQQITATYTPVYGAFSSAGATLDRPVVTERVMLPEPSLAGYPIIRTYVYFSGERTETDYSCQIDYGDGMVVEGRVESRSLGEFICSDEVTTNHVYQNLGTFLLTFTIKNKISGGETAAIFEHVVVADPDPGYIAWTPSPAVKNQPVTFTTTQIADIYYWMLVSGPDIPMPMMFGFGQSVEFIPPAAGTYKVELFLYDLDETGHISSMAADGAEVVVVEPVQADLSLTKTDSKDPVKPGATLVYTLTVTNLGPDAAQTLTLVDTLDRNTKYVSVAAPRGWSCRYANYAVTCTRSSLASGSSAVIKITVTVNKTARLGKELVNNAVVSSVTYDPLLTNNTVVQKTLVMK